MKLIANTERVKEWEAKKPPPIEGDTSEHHMTQQYYTEKILPGYIQLLHEQRTRNELSPIRWQLQEDGDPSHGTRSSNNVAADLRDVSWLPVIVHPPQRGDLNPIEGIWLILKQRAKRRIRWPEEGQQQWDARRRCSERYSRKPGRPSPWKRSEIASPTCPEGVMSSLRTAARSFAQKC